MNSIRFTAIPFNFNYAVKKTVNDVSSIVRENLTLGSASELARLLNDKEKKKDGDRNPTNKYPPRRLCA